MTRQTRTDEQMDILRTQVEQRIDAGNILGRHRDALLSLDESGQSTEEEHLEWLTTASVHDILAWVADLSR